MAKKRLSPILDPKKAPRARKATPAPEPDAGPNLTHIAEGLRPLAVAAADLHFDPANARTHGEKNLEGIRGSLAVYGQRKPMVVRRDGNVVIAGNGTLQAALSLGWTHVAAVFVDDDAATAAGYSIADNRTGDLAGWDKDALDKLLREVSTGNDERLDAMLAELAGSTGLYGTGEAAGRSDSVGTPDEAGTIDPADEWRGMPEYQHEDLTSAHKCVVHFATDEDLRRFEELVGQTIPKNTKSIWYPKAERDVVKAIRYLSDEP